MKQRIKNLLPILTLVIAVTLSFAFKSVNTVAHDCIWFVYNGPQPADITDARNPLNWDYSATEPDCDGGTKLCAICVPFNEIYDNGTEEEPEDDKPIVDEQDPGPQTDAYTQLGLAFNSGTVTWTARVHVGGSGVHITTKP